MTDQNNQNQAGYETRDINVKKTVLLTLTGVIIMAIILVGLNEYFFYAKEKAYYENTLLPESDTLISLRATEDSILGSYGYADSAKTEYRIPINEAMKIYLREKGK